MLSAVHIPGKDNETADYMSRLQNENIEWRLSPIIFQRVFEFFYCKREIDLFASCMIYQVDQYVSWYADRNAMAIDTFSILWSELNFYVFSLFSIIGAAIAKVRREECLGDYDYIMVENTVLVSMMVSLLKNFPTVLPPNILNLPSKKSAKHPLYLKMKSLAVCLPGKASETQTFQEK